MGDLVAPIGNQCLAVIKAQCARRSHSMLKSKHYPFLYKSSKRENRNLGNFNFLNRISQKVNKLKAKLKQFYKEDI